MTVAIRDVLRVVGQHFDVSANEIRSMRRTRHVLPARHVCAYLAHRLSRLTMKEIGDQLGGRDHTIIAMYCRTVARRAEEDKNFTRLLLDLEARIQGAQVRGDQ